MRALVLLALVIVLSIRGSAETLELAKNGESSYSIWIPDKSSPTPALAAEELDRYIEQMSGAKLPITSGSAIPEKAVVIRPADENTQPQLTGDMYSISVVGSRIYLIGSRDRSVLYAAYDFLYRLGCRFLAPRFEHYQGSAEYIPRESTLKFSCDKPTVEKPVLSIRKLYVEEGHSHNAENLAQMIEWMPKARFNMLVVPTDYQGRGRVKWDNWREKLTPLLQERDITLEVGGHGYQNFLNAEMENGTLFEKHPEWFGMDEKGERRKEHGRVFCLSNAEARNYLIANFIEYIKARPEIRTYAFWPPDGASWCACPNCTAIGGPADQQAFLLSKVKEAVAKVRPDLRLEIIAYAKAIAPPEKLKLDKSVLVDFCPIGQCFEVQINDPSSPQNAEYVRQLQAWRKAFDGDISIYSYYRKYAWVSLPVLIPHYMQTDLQWYAKAPVQGISSYAEPGDWFTYELNHYILGNLAWNPDADVNALIGKFCNARYGKYSEMMARIFRMMEDVVRHDCSIPGTSLKSAEELTKAIGQLDDAAAYLKAEQTSVSAPGTRYNFGRVILMLQYAKLDLEVQKARASNESKEEIRKKALAFAQFAKAHMNDGVIVFHSRHEEPRLFRDYGVAD